MSANPDRLYELMPVVYRMRDADQGYPLRDLLRVLSTQANVLERDIARLYDNWFIETCDDWVVPYIGDLLGYSLLPEAATLAVSALSLCVIVLITAASIKASMAMPFLAG